MIPLIILLSLILLTSILAIYSSFLAAREEEEKYKKFFGSKNNSEDSQEDKEHYEQGLRIMTDASRGIRSPEYPIWREEENRKKKTARVFRGNLN